MDTVPAPRGPSDLLYATDPARALAGLAAWPLSRQIGRLAPRGHGRPVLVLPGLLTGDRSTRPLRSLLRDRGFQVHGWLMGRNIGPTPRIESGVRERLERLAERYDAPVALVGWSLGGLFARALAAERPDLVTQVITLGTPFALLDRRQTRAQAQYDRFAHLHVRRAGLVPEHVRNPLPVPATSIWSRQDGIVAWQASLEQPSATVENIAVLGSHLGLGHNPAVLWAVADRLGQPAGQWRPFVAPRWLGPLYPALEVTSLAA